MTRQDQFKKYCGKLFQFLEKEYSCEVTTQEDNTGVFITYKNKTTAVRVSYEYREETVFILFSKLIEGELPQYPIITRQQTKIYSFYLDDILSFKLQAEKNKQVPKKKNTGEELFDKLSFYAMMIKKYTSDLLIGNFSIFPHLEEIVKKRALAKSDLNR